MGAGKQLWGWYPTNKIWVPLQVDENGKVIVDMSAVNLEVTHHTTDATLAAESNALHTNLGATGDITLTLPQNPPRGCYFHFAVMAPYQLRVDPGAAGAIYINGAKQTDNKYIWADDEGESVMLVADGNGDWVALYSVGTWGVEP